MLPYMSHIIDVINCSLENKAYCKPIVAHGLKLRLIGCPQSVGKTSLTCIVQIV